VKNYPRQPVAESTRNHEHRLQGNAKPAA